MAVNKCSFLGTSINDQHKEIRTRVVKKKTKNPHEHEHERLIEKEKIIRANQKQNNFLGPLDDLQFIIDRFL